MVDILFLLGILYDHLMALSVKLCVFRSGYGGPSTVCCCFKVFGRAL